MAINSYDIVSTLQALGMMKYWKGKHIILKKQVSNNVLHSIFSLDFSMFHIHLCKWIASSCGRMDGRYHMIESTVSFCKTEPPAWLRSWSASIELASSCCRFESRSLILTERHRSVFGNPQLTGYLLFDDPAWRVGWSKVRLFNELRPFVRVYDGKMHV